MAMGHGSILKKDGDRISPNVADEIGNGDVAAVVFHTPDVRMSWAMGG
jgi:hypothetical protein